MVDDRDLYNAEIILYGDENAHRGSTGRHSSPNNPHVMRDSALQILTSALPETAESYDVLLMLGFRNPTISDSIMLAMALRAQRGDADAARFIRDTSGQNSLQGVQEITDENVDRVNLAALSDDELYALLEDVDEYTEDPPNGADIGSEPA